MRQRKRIRRYNWDYGATACYLITIITHERFPYFGTLKDGEMALSKIGVIAKERWLETPKKYPHVEIGEFIIMPNHMHAILHFNRKRSVAERKTKLGPETHTLSIPIRGFKAAVTSRCISEGLMFKWQSSYHDRVLVDQDALKAATEYIVNNPKEHSKHA